MFIAEKPATASAFKREASTGSCVSSSMEARCEA